MLADAPRGSLRIRKQKQIQKRKVASGGRAAAHTTGIASRTEAIFVII